MIARKTEYLKSPLCPKPEWVEAFMILLLHKTGGSLTVSLADLERFEKLDCDKNTIINIDSDKGLVTIMAPEIKTGPKITIPEPLF